MTQSAPGKAHRKGITLVEAVQMFTGRAKAVEKMFIEARWPNGIACPLCGSLTISQPKSRKTPSFQVPGLQEVFLDQVPLDHARFQAPAEPSGRWRST